MRLLDTGKIESKRTRCIIRTGVGGKGGKSTSTEYSVERGRFVARACRVWNAHATVFSQECKDCRCRTTSNRYEECQKVWPAPDSANLQMDKQMGGRIDDHDVTVPAVGCRNFVPACWASRTEIRTLLNLLYHVQSAEWNAQATLFDVPGARRGCCDSASETPRCRCLSWRSLGHEHEHRHEQRDRIGFPWYDMIRLLIYFTKDTIIPKGPFLGIAGGLSHIRPSRSCQTGGNDAENGQTDRQTETSLLAVETAHLCKQGLPAWGLSGRRYTP